VSFLYSQTLFVDALNGNDSTAVLGDLTHPWQTISGALNAAYGYFTGGTSSEFTVHVFKGTYIETQQVVISGYTNISLYMETGANARIQLEAYSPYWVSILDGAKFNIAGTGRMNSNIFAESNVKTIILQSGSRYSTTLTVSNISLTSQISIQPADFSSIIESNNSYTTIDNSWIGFTQKSTSRQHVIHLNQSILFIKDSSLEFNNSYYGESVGLAQFSWLIFEEYSAPMGSRIRLHQTSLSNITMEFEGPISVGFIYTNPLSIGLSILLDDVYFHCAKVNVMQTLWNDSALLTDNYYCNAYNISAGAIPSGAFTPAWNEFPTTVSLLKPLSQTIKPY